VGLFIVFWLLRLDIHISRQVLGEN
jgi:hypothetical protein